LPHGSVRVERTPPKVEEIVLDGNSLASLSTSETLWIAYDRRPDSALITEFRTAQNAHFSKQSRADTTVRVNPATASLANLGRESSWSGIRQIQLRCGFRFSDRVTIANPGSCRYSTSLCHAIAVSSSRNHRFTPQNEADVVWFLMCFYVKIYCC
jgi:hypothetical protein